MLVFLFEVLSVAFEMAVVNVVKKRTEPKANLAVQYAPEISLFL